MKTALTLVALTAASISPSYSTNAFVVQQSSLPSSKARTTSALASRLTADRPRKKNSIALSKQHGASNQRQKVGGGVAVVDDTTTLGTLQVPVVGIGTISWSSDNPFKLESKELQTVVNTACRSNAAFFDTAERYGSHYKTALGLGWGETERMTNLLLQTTNQQSSSSSTAAATAVVATKFTPSPWRNTVESVVQACEQSRERLGVDQIDLYQLHMPDIVQPLRFLGKDRIKDQIYWDGLAECYHRGLVKNVGVSNYGPTLLMQCQEALARRDVPLASNQIAYSLIGRHNGAQETVDKCDELGIRVLGYFPFAMGLLTGKYSDVDVEGRSDSSTSKSGHDEQASLASVLFTSQKTKLEEMDLNRYARGDGGTSIPAGGVDPLIQVMRAIAEQRGKTIAQVALNYIICKGVIPIPGARTNSQVMDNIGAMGWRLSDTEVDLLEMTADSLGFGFEGAGFKRTSEKFVGYGVEKWSLN